MLANGIKRAMFALGHHVVLEKKNLAKECSEQCSGIQGRNKFQNFEGTYWRTMQVFPSSVIKVYQK